LSLIENRSLSEGTIKKKVSCIQIRAFDLLKSGVGTLIQGNC
jgi:hypothetical protein